MGHPRKVEISSITAIIIILKNCDILIVRTFYVIIRTKL